jgi:hypothetical protein
VVHYNCCVVAAEPPAVYTGPAAIHGLLLQQLRLNAWHLVLSSLDAEITHMLGLPARLQPAAAAARAAAGVSRSSTIQQQQQLQRQGTAASGDISAAAGTAAGAASAAMQSVSTGTGTTSTAAAAAAGVRSSSSSSALQRQLLASSAGGHFSFYATLSSLVLQAVIGSAAAAGEDCVLQQQQQQQQGRGDADTAAAAAAAAAMVVDVSRGSSRGATPAAADGSSVDGLLFGEIDVGGPWERAAAAAAAAAGGGGRMLLQDPAAAADADMQAAAAAAAARAEGVYVEPQLLSLRPLALGHLLVTQLGQLLTSPYRPHDIVQVAAVSYTNHARQALEFKRQKAAAEAAQRQQQGGSSAAAAAAARLSNAAGRDGPIAGDGSSSKAAVPFLLLPQVSFMTCLSRWLAHSSSRELLRAKLDEQLLMFPGITAQTLQCFQHCVSAVLLSPLIVPAAAAAAAAVRPNHQQQRQQRGVDPSDSDPRSGTNVLVMLSDTSITLEGPGLGLVAGARGLLGQHRRPRDTQQPVAYLHALPGLLAPLLQQMHSSSSSSDQ